MYIQKQYSFFLMILFKFFEAFSLRLIIIFVTFNNFMCFLKTLRPLDQISVSKANLEPQAQNQFQVCQAGNKSQILNELFMSTNSYQFFSNEQCLMNLFNLINYNGLQIQKLSHKITQSQGLLDFSHNQLKEMQGESSTLTLDSTDLSNIQMGEYTNDLEETPVDPLISKIFGRKKYQYKLQPQQELPSVLFKERNFNISVNLLDENNQKVLNSNIIHLCLGVCDVNGEWITQNRAGEPFMKGKTEVQMYHGEGSILKVYARDVSRSYPEGKVNFILYPKASMLKFSSNASSLEKVVQSHLIEPLLIKDVSIRAKKKD